MMKTPKETASELVDLFKEFANDEYHECSEQFELNENKHKNAKQCALLCVQKLIKHVPSIDTKPPNFGEPNESTSDYWNEVKTEITNL